MLVRVIRQISGVNKSFASAMSQVNTVGLPKFCDFPRRATKAGSKGVGLLVTDQA